MAVRILRWENDEPHCEACAVRHPVPTWGWRIRSVLLCKRCKLEQQSQDSEFEVVLSWVEPDVCYVIRRRRVRDQGGTASDRSVSASDPDRPVN